jgi:hypothetical protein
MEHFMEKLRKAMHDDKSANPFGIQMEGPLQRSATASTHAQKINTKVAESTDLGLFGTRHPNGDWG